MTTTIGMIVMVVLFAAVGVALLHPSRQKSTAGWQRLVVSLLSGLVILFLLWMATMVLVVGPGMRTI